MKYQVMVIKVKEVAIIEIEEEDFLQASDEAVKKIDDLHFIEPWEEMRVITAQYFPQFGGIGIR